jgi:hypothetical protein
MTVREPRQPKGQRPLLPPEKRAAEVAKIVGKEWRDSVAGILPVLAEMQRDAADDRARKQSERDHDKRLSKRFAAALRRMTDVVDKSPWRDEPFPRSHLDVLMGFSAAWTHRIVTESLKPRRNADAKWLAARMALFICRECGVEPATTLGGKFEMIAAELYGDLDADMSHHCRAVLRAERETARGIKSVDWR